MTDAFTPRPRRPRDENAPRDLWPAIAEALRDLLAESEAIVNRGRGEFDSPHSLTYRAAESVIIHFADLVATRLPRAAPGRIPEALPVAAIAATRNILARDYRSADTDIVWSAITLDLPAAIRSLLGDDDPGGAPESARVGR